MAISYQVNDIHSLGCLGGQENNLPGDTIYSPSTLHGSCKNMTTLCTLEDTLASPSTLHGHRIWSCSLFPLTFNTLFNEVIALSEDLPPPSLVSFY